MSPLIPKNAKWPSKIKSLGISLLGSSLQSSKQSSKNSLGTSKTDRGSKREYYGNLDDDGIEEVRLADANGSGKPKD